MIKKENYLPFLAVAGGLLGFVLRRWQLASAYRPETGLFVHGAPATNVLLGLLALMALACLLLLIRQKEGPEDFLPAFGDPGVGQMTGLAAAGLLLMLAGGLGMQEGFRGIRMWQSAPELYQLSNPASQLLAGGLCVLGGFGILYMGRMAYRGQLYDWACRMASFPALAGLVWLFAAHLKNGTEPVLLKYGFQLTAILLLTLAHYYIAAFLFGRPHPRRTLFLTLMGSVVGITALADQPDLFTAIGLLAFLVSALTFARSLLRSTFSAPWPERMPPEEETDDA